MKIQRVKGDRERRILIALITNPVVLGRISSIWKYDSFQSRVGNIISKLCVEYYQNHGKKAPSANIMGMVASYCDNNKDKTVINELSTFIESISEEFERSEDINPQYIIDIAGKHFTEVRIRNTIELAQGNLDCGDLDKAVESMQGFSKVTLESSCGSHPMHNPEKINSIFYDDEYETLVKYPSGLGQFFKDIMVRDSFVSFLGPEKSGKSFMLHDLAYRALSCRKKVALFEVGDMTEKQVLRRFSVRLAKQPLKPCTIDYPISIQPNQKPEVKTKVFKEGLNAKRAWDAYQEFITNKIRSDESYLYLDVRPNLSVNVDGIRSALEAQELQGWGPPDIVVVDYSDNLAPPPGASKLAPIDQINKTWKMLRALSMDLHCLLVTATQARRDAAKAKYLTIQHIADDKRKAAEVTAMVGINVTEQDKEWDVMRLNWVARREGAYTHGRCVHMAACLPLANPAVCSTF